MNSDDIRRFEMLVRVREFGTAHADRFPSDSPGGMAFAVVAAAVTGLSGHAAAQVTGRSSVREGASSKAVARQALRDELDAIARTARALALDTPGLEDRFRRPAPNLGDQALIAAARACLQNAGPLGSQFVGYGMAGDFLAQLETCIAGVEDSILDRDGGRATHVAASAAIEDALDSALAAVRRLDAIVPNRLRDDAPAMAMWRRARHVEYRGARSRPEGEATAAVIASPDA